MRHLTLLSVIAVCLCAGLSANCQQSAAGSAYVFREHYTRSSFYIPMRDGVRLYTTVYEPNNQSQKWPFLMQRTPYSVRPYTPGEYFTPRGIVQKMAEEGYIFVFQDVRGRYMSEGVFKEVRPETANPSAGKSSVDESTDTYDTIDWLVKSVPNNNGRVGIWGISYPGFYAGAAGINSHLALRAISPQAPVSDWFIGDDDHHNGALFLLDFVGFYNGFGMERKPGTTVESYPPAPSLGISDAYRFYLELGSLKNVDAKYWHGRVEHWNDVQAHPNYDEWWKQRSLPLHLKDVKCAVMFVGGWYDAEDKYGPFADFAAVNKFDPATPNSLVIGPWTHGGWSGGDFASFGTEQFGFKTGAWYRDNMFKPFFDYYLKDTGTWDKAKVTVFDTGLNQFWHFDQWPPADTTPLTLRFASDHKLTTDPARPTTSDEFDEYISDPANPVPYISQSQARRRNEYLNDDQRFASSRHDVLTYQTEPVAEDTTIVGVIRADIQIAMTGSDADFIVKVIDVQPEGAPDAGFQRLVRAEVMRGRFRDSYSNPKPITPRKVTEVAFDVRDVSHTFLKGHRIMVQVQSSWFPLVDRNPQSYVPNIYKADEKDFVARRIRVFHTSKIILPELKHLPGALPVDSSYKSP